MDRRTFLAGAAGVGSLSLAGCSALRGGSASANESEDADYDIGMGSAFFRPETFEIGVGETVVWRNTGNRRHTVTAYEDQIPDDADYFASGGFDSEQAARDGWTDGFGGRINAGATYEVTFDVPGEYHYFCIPHEPTGMVGKIVVTE
ncbi:plastocyanin/azurin family copper-binding protein [Halorussus sp. MSC15.2]|uniref:plastocyanin/azurin family copper-binding protein n=1 Tax=Halorussus sp. MSC15.2 TaxID=2283638 RepID=UPI0013D1778D|nr:plastocyanin/azurin family copper-binding protein [Halorussus sp. MSC15.2]NEU56769.1 halocyanin [Halorussus sp. MSC15.2]